MSTFQKNIFNITDRVIVITGGLGQLGRQYCQILLEHGARVAVFDLPKLPPEEFVSRFEGHFDKLSYFQVDIANKSSIEKALEGLMKIWGSPHGLINNAAIDSPPDAPAEENGPFETYPESSWDKIMEVNVKGVFFGLSNCWWIHGQGKAWLNCQYLFNLWSSIA